MARVEVTWEDETHTPCVAAGIIEDRSPGGVCIRINAPIAVGLKLTIKTYREQLSGIVTNSRPEDKIYIVGIKLDLAANAEPVSPTSTIPIARQVK